MLLCIMAIQNDNDRRTVEELYLQNYRIMMYIAMKILKDKSKAEDAVSQAFIKIIDKLQKFNFEDCNKTRGLIGILVKDICYDMLKAEKRQNYISIDECDIPAPSEDLPYDNLASEENYQTILNALTGLSEKSRNILKLRYVYGYSDLEMSELLNISQGNIRVRLHRAKVALLQALKEKQNEQSDF
ncbi:RNA polymerase sigma factor [Caproicibacter fermentans]|uniref:Sigma-70 family RNA polymerase sigma factor n=1 Tax=Caproicibacter fermentans TaxID=2576756 RepID=A0A7G8TFC4_9FIRM|nr:sigma-70 family RNA polymerase sigma factor [Caproicibacter fermentans]QNK42315.1 sigma-70 family RNA polymerase sigma factor [Caproicibacter fermentans]